MIPFLLPFWKFRKAILWIGIVAAFSVLGWRVSAWRQAYKALPEAQAALEAERACGEGSKCYARLAALQAAQQAVSETVVENYERELADLRNRPVPPRRIIRVCADPSDVQSPGPAGTPDGTGPASGVIHGPVEFDPRPLFDLAREADQLAARLRALQDYSRAVSAPPP